MPQMWVMTTSTYADADANFPLLESVDADANEDV